MKRNAMAVLLALAACGGDAAKGGDDTMIVDTSAVDTSAVDTAPGDTALADGDAEPACSADDRAACRYRPAATYAVAEPLTFDAIAYADALGATRSVAVAVYQPVDAPQPAPVVVLSHGGSNGKTDPLNSMDKWAPTLAKAGYFAVTIAHPARDTAAYEAMCDHLGVPDDIPCAIKIDWDRPHDVARVLDWLAEKAEAGGPLAGKIDLDHVAHVGHSAGAGCALMLAGASRNYVCDQPFGYDQGSIVACDTADLVDLRDDRVDVALAFSPQGPGAAGFMTESFAAVPIPLLTATGANDGDPGEPDNRRGVYDALPSSVGGLDFARLYIDDQGAKHTLFEAETDACDDVGDTTLERCTEMRSWLYSAAVAFLDWHVRGRAEAGAWLRSDDLVTASDGTVTWDVK